MRCICLLVALVSSVVLAAGQASNDDAMGKWLKNSATGANDDNLNLDPDLSETNRGTGTSKFGAEKTEENLVACTTEDGRAGVCVKYYLCDQDSKTVIEDGYTIIDIREGAACAKFLDICCLRNKVMEDKVPDVKKKNISKTTPTLFTVAESTDDKTALSFPVGGGLGLNRGTNLIGKCGISNPGVSVFGVRDGYSPDSRIYADFGEYPWMVAILTRSQSEEKWKKQNYVGGGTLIHPSVVMTVAHRVNHKKPEDIKIRAGEWDTNTLDEEYDYLESDVAKIVVHQNYFRTSLYNDVALLFLQRPVEISEKYPNIGIACLGKHLPAPNTQCFSMGWGAADFNNKNVYAPILKKVKLPLLDSAVCESMLQKTRLGKMFKLHSSLVCAGGEQGVDTCRGDGGSSLVCPINAGGTRYAVFGMVAYGISCGVKDIPGVYVNVPTVYDWVTQQVAAEGLDANAFVYY